MRKVEERIRFRGGAAERYGAALFDLAEGEGALKDVRADLEAFVEAAQESPLLGRLLSDPCLGREERGRALEAVLKAMGLHRLVENSLRLLLKKGRLVELRGVLESLKAHEAERDGVERAQIVSARALKAEERGRLEEVLRKRFGKGLFLEEAVDSSLGGGVVLRFGGRMIDASLSGKLAGLGRSLFGSGF